TTQPFGFCFDIALLQANSRAELLERIKMDIHWSCANSTAPWGRDARTTKPCQQWTKNQERRPHSFDQIIGSFQVTDCSCGDGDFMVTQPSRLRTKFSQQAQCRSNIDESRDLFEATFFFGQQCGKQQWQRGIL